jgi:hypothetical protein
MTKYYKSDNVYFIMSNEKLISISVYDDDHIDVEVSEYSGYVFDYTGLEECEPSEALAAFHKFENRCKEIINSTGV